MVNQILSVGQQVISLKIQKYIPKFPKHLANYIVLFIQYEYENWLKMEEMLLIVLNLQKEDENIFKIRKNLTDQNNHKNNFTLYETHFKSTTSLETKRTSIFDTRFDAEILMMKKIVSVENRQTKFQDFKSCVC